MVVIATVSSEIEIGESRQITALARKAVQYQKRQMFTNVCCITLCPFLMVFLSAIMGNFISELIMRSTTANEFVYCSKLPGMNSINVPFWGTVGVQVTGPQEIPGATQSTIYHPNWSLLRLGLTLRGVDVNSRPGATVGTFRRPCVLWYGNDYPKSSVYERPPNVSGILVRDSSFLAEPLTGYIPALIANFDPRTSSSRRALFDSTSINIFINHNLEAGALFSFDRKLFPADFGTKAKQPMLNLTEFLALASTQVPDFPSATNLTGLLDTIPTRFYVDFELGNDPKLNGFQPVPWYNQTTATVDELDDMIAKIILNVIDEIKNVDKTGLDSANARIRAPAVLRIQKILKKLPHGAIYFNKLDHATKKYSWSYLFGNDRRLQSGSNFPPSGLRLLYQQTQLDNALLRHSNVTSYGSAQITQGLRIMPELRSSKLDLPFGGLIGSILYPFGVSFLLPVFTVALVTEKEYRIEVMMRMNGMRNFAYYFSHFVTFLILYIVSAIIFIITGFATKLTMFTVNDLGLLVILFMIWGVAQIAMAFFFSTLFNKSRIALVVVFLMVLCSVIISLVFEQLFMNLDMPVALFIWAPFAFYRALAILNYASYDSTLIPYRIQDLFKSNEVSRAALAMFLMIFVFALLAIYFTNVFPSEFGVKRPWHYPISDLIKKFRKDSPVKVHSSSVIIEDEKTDLEDADVKAERQRVCSPDFKTNDPLVMRNMRKVYAGRGGSGPKLAVRDVSLSIPKGMTFGLLGPNGAVMHH
jgi:ABC-type multidrug transport system fused ATPase/permease subunit